MKFTAKAEQSTKERDAGLVNDLYRKSRYERTDENKQTYANAAEWFTKKHKCDWQEWLPDQEIKR